MKKVTADDISAGDPRNVLLSVTQQKPSSPALSLLNHAIYDVESRYDIDLPSPGE